MDGLMTSPKTVPARVWELWLRHRLSSFGWEDCTDAPEYIHPRPFLEKAIFDPHCECVWMALNRRFSESAVRFVFDGIQESTEGPAGTHALVPHKFRDEKGRRLVRLAAELRKAICDVAGSRTLDGWQHQPAELPFEITHTLTPHLYELARRQRGRSDPQLSVEEMMLVEAIVGNFDKVLTALEVGAQAWSLTKPKVTNKGGDPSRLFFVRRMTEIFREVFDTPLREQVAALARCVYGSGIDASTVAKLAP